MKKNVYSFLMVVFLLISSASIIAQDQGEISDQQTLEDDQSGLVSFDFKDADIRNVLRIFSHKTGINIVASSDVQGSVTVKLNNVPWEKALKIILEMEDFAYVKDGNVIKVLTQDRIAQEPLKTEVIALDYAKANQVQSTVQPMLSDRGTIQIDERANLLIITDIPAKFDSITKVIKRLDTPTQQVLVETKLIETTLTLNKKFGIKWTFLDNYRIGYSGIGGGDFTKSKTITESDGFTSTLTGTKDYGTMEETFDQLYTTRTAPGRSRYTAYSTDPSATAADEAGYYAQRSELPTYNHQDWVTSGGEFTRGFGKTLADTDSFSETISKAAGTVLTASNMGLVMSALMSDNGTDILSAPSIVTMDNKEASIKVASDYPIPNFTYNDETGDYEISGFTPTPIGITLTVTPHVAPNGYVTLELRPEVSESSSGVAMNNVTIPIIAKENIQTTAMVKDGDTIVLGGLMRQFDDYDNQKVPILHSIPFLGWLFKSKEKEIQKRNLLIFVTPTILKKENVRTISQNHVDKYTKLRDSFDESTELYPSLEQ